MRWKPGACTGGHKGRPYGVLSTWSVGRGAHTPPNQACNPRIPAIDSLVGAASRPAPSQPPGPPGISARHRRPEGMPPYEAGRGCGGNRGPVRADMKSAPTDAPAAPSRCRGAFYMRPDRTAGTNGLAVIATRPWRQNGNGIHAQNMPASGVRFPEAGMFMLIPRPGRRLAR